MGFEPTNRGFAGPRLSPLGYGAQTISSNLGVVGSLSIFSLPVRNRFGSPYYRPAMARFPHVIAFLTALCWPAPLAAQWWDAQQPRGGELQIGLTGQNVTVDQRFLADGTRQPLSDVFNPVLDARLVPQLDSLDAILAQLFPTLGLALPAASTLGDLRYDVLLERTWAPVSLNFGATDWLSAFAVIPIVEGKSFAETQFDSLVANAGDATSAFGEDPDQLFQDLNTGITSLDSLVATGTLPPDQQTRAQQLVTDARDYEAGMAELRQQAYVPTDSGTAGRDLTGFYEELRSGFQDFGVTLPAIPLAGAIPTDQAVALTSGPEFGIQAPESRGTGIKFGDIELGLSVQPYNTFRRRPNGTRPRVPWRLRLDALYRLATGSPPKAERIFDIGTGDGQPDLELRGTFDVGFGSRLWLSLFAGYNIQLTGEVERLGAYVTTVSWNPGDVLTLMAAPRFNLTRTITFSGLLTHLRHARDEVSPVGTVDDTAPFAPADLEQGTEYSATSIGFAARYSTTDWAGDRRAGIPVEIELSYLHTVSGRDGLAPQRDVWQIGLRYYQAIFK